MLKKHTADDDSESQKRTDVQSPEVCVDYLSYTFDEMDLAASWRVMTKQKKDIVNGIRLENASWRTWAKQRNHLKTISPETLNWLKDSDVTWLYGPLHTVTKTDHHHDRYAPKESSAHDKLGLIHASDPPLTDKGITGTYSAPPLASTTVTRIPSDPSAAEANTNNQATAPTPTPTPTPTSEQRQQQQQQKRRPLKSALKKVTMSDILRRSASEFHVSDLNHHAAGSAISLSEANRQLGVFSPAVVATHRQPKLRFNQRVEQYMVISDDDGSSANGSIHKVKMTANLPSHYDVASSDHHASSTATANGRLLHSHLDDSSTDDEDDEDDQDGTLHRHRGRRDSRYIVNNNDDDEDDSDDIDGDENDDDGDDDGDDDDYGIVMHHHHHSSPMITRPAPRSIKRIEPAVLKSSSYSDASVASSHRGSLSSWDDDDNDSDRRSVHLPDYQLHRPATAHTPDQSSIQWEGQSCVVYDVAPSETESDFVEDDWDLRRESFDNNTIDEGNNNDVDDEDDMTGTGAGDTAENPVAKGKGKAWQKLPMRLDPPNPNQVIDPPAILSPGKAFKSPPISEPSTIDATHQHPSSSSIVDQQQASSAPSVFGNLGQWASSYFWKS